MSDTKKYLHTLHHPIGQLAMAMFNIMFDDEGEQEGQRTSPLSSRRQRERPSFITHLHIYTAVSVTALHLQLAFYVQPALFSNTIL